MEKLYKVDNKGVFTGLVKTADESTGRPPGFVKTEPPVTQGDEVAKFRNDPARTFAERVFINKALTWRRDDPTLQAAAEALELSSEQVDQLFIAADQALAAG